MKRMFLILSVCFAFITRAQIGGADTVVIKGAEGFRQFYKGAGAQTQDSMRVSFKIVTNEESTWMDAIYLEFKSDTLAGSAPLKTVSLTRQNGILQSGGQCRFNNMSVTTVVLLFDVAFKRYTSCRWVLLRCVNRKGHQSESVYVRIKG